MISIDAPNETCWWQTTNSSSHEYSSPSFVNKNIGSYEREILCKPLLLSSQKLKDEENFEYELDSVTTFDSTNTMEEQPVTLKYVAISILALTGIASSVASIVFASGLAIISGPALYLVLAAGGLTAVMSPIMLRNEKHLVKAESKREGIRKLQKQVDILSEENVKLEKNNDELEVKVKELKTLEQSLDGIVTQAGKTVLSFLKLVKEYERISKDKQSVIKTIVLQDIIAILISQDTNQNFKMDEQEMDDLLLALDTYGVEIKDKKDFRKRTLENPSIDSVLLEVKMCMDEQEIIIDRVMGAREGSALLMRLSMI